MTEDLEATYNACLEAYRDDPTDENKAAYREAAAALASARSESRIDRVPVSSNGDAAVQPETVAASTAITLEEE